MSVSIKINQDGTLAGYLPKKVFTALYYKELIKKVNGQWVIPEEKREHVQNLKIVNSDPTQIKESIQQDGLTLSVGDLFNHSWGYDQTNQEFLVIVGFTKSKKSAKCRMVYARKIEEKSGRGHDALMPENIPYGDTFTMRIQTTMHGKELSLRGSYPYLRDGIMKEGKRLATFWKCKEGRTYSQTAAGWGH